MTYTNLTHSELVTRLDILERKMQLFEYYLEYIQVEDELTYMHDPNLANLLTELSKLNKLIER